MNFILTIKYNSFIHLKKYKYMISLSSQKDVCDVTSCLPEGPLLLSATLGNWNSLCDSREVPSVS